MHPLNIDKRDKKDIVEEIQKRADSYVPEWRMNLDNPDIGTALALVYANLYSQTIKRLNRVMEKNRIAFFNDLGADLLPAVPSNGYIQFLMVGAATEGIEIPKGTSLSADVQTAEGESLGFKTIDDIYVIPIKLNAMFYTSDRNDYISNIYKEDNNDIILFDKDGKNSQYHELYFCHDWVLDIQKNAWVQLKFFSVENQFLSKELLMELINTRNIEFTYYSKEGFIPFAQQKIENSSLMFFKSENQPGFERTVIEKKESFWIRCVVKNIYPFEKLFLESIEFYPKGLGLLPDVVIANGIENHSVELFPFGDRFSVYNEAYFACNEAFCKKGAKIELACNLRFARVALDSMQENESVQWEWIMNRSDFKVDHLYDITIQEVIWEYFNGSGWVRLFKDGSYGDFFSIENSTKGRYVKMYFSCPDDMEKILSGGWISYFIRVRILKVNNAFKTKGYYISPILENISFSYDYNNTLNKMNPSLLVAKNNLETKLYTPLLIKKQGGIFPFSMTGLKAGTIYMGFDRPITGSPVKFLIIMRNAVERKKMNLNWEYYSAQGWQELNLVDETENLSRTGIVTIVGDVKFQKQQIFAQEAYWIRIIDCEENYLQINKESLPCISRIAFNTTKTINSNQSLTQYFQMRIYQENARFDLVGNSVISIKVSVDERDSLSLLEIEELNKAGMAEIEYDKTGMMERVWVFWKAVDDFIYSREEDRHYLIDYNEGFIIFGNGQKGKIPNSARRENIRVIYECGGGELSNVPIGKVNKLNQSILTISQITNPEKFIGGCDMEKLDDAIHRSAAFIRNQGKAVTIRDFEELALAACRSISRIKGFSGYDGQGRKLSGAVTLVILQKEFKNGSLQFGTIKNQVEKYMLDKISGTLRNTGKFFITEPMFIEMAVYIEVLTEDYNKIFSVRKALQEKLNRFIDPICGGFDGAGWKIGTCPNLIQIRNAVITIKEIITIVNLSMTAYSNTSSGRKEIDISSIPSYRYALPISGEHEVIIKIE